MISWLPGGLSSVMAATGAGVELTLGDQQPTLQVGDLALTSTRLNSDQVTAEIARRQPDGTWRWVIDQWSVLGKPAQPPPQEGMINQGEVQPTDHDLRLENQCPSRGLLLTCLDT
jgi:hypothetical protein